MAKERSIGVCAADVKAKCADVKPGGGRIIDIYQSIVPFLSSTIQRRICLAHLTLASFFFWENKPDESIMVIGAVVLLSAPVAMAKERSLGSVRPTSRQNVLDVKPGGGRIKTA